MREGNVRIDLRFLGIAKRKLNNVISVAPYLVRIISAVGKCGKMF